MGRLVQMGREYRVYVNGATYAAPSWTWAKKGRDKTIDASRDTVEADTEETAADGYKAYEVGLRDWKLTYQTLKPAAGETDAAFDLLEAAHESGDPVDILVVEGGALATDGLAATRVLAGISKHTDGAALNGVATLDLEFFNMGSTDQAVPVKGTTASGAFVAGS